jgi:Tfp pilus assembly protein PilF
VRLIQLTSALILLSVIVRGSGVSEFRSSGVPGFRGSGVPGFGGSGVPGFRSSEVQEFRGSEVPSFRGTAYVFTTTDCPVANRYAPEIQRLHRTYAKQGIRFQLVYVNPRESADSVREHAQRFGYDIETVRDAQHALVKQFGITVTPEAALVDEQGRLLYRGRIDDRYLDIGIDRQRATKHELEDALRAVVEGRRVLVTRASAVGCIVADFQEVTFTRDVAPVLFDKCTSCHRPAGPAPFSLLTYADARQRASLIASVTEKRFMPPYNADSNVGSFQGQKRLTPEEITLLRQWADTGATEGLPTDLPASPDHPARWQLGAPDLVVSTSDPYLLKPEPRDVFRIFVIRLPVTSTKYVTGIEFDPGNARVVHHANIRLDYTPGSRDLDARDPAPGYDGLLARSAVYPDGHFLGWTPGQIAPLVPSDLAWRLEPGTDLVVQLHMQPSGAPEAVQPSIAFFFTDRVPTRTPTILRLGSQGINIPPGESRYIIRDSYLLPVDVELHALQPHAHYRLREARGTATSPDGSTQSLIQIGDWDFRWQHVYRFKTPVHLRKGTRVSMEYRYDNSPENPRNPRLPPEHVSWGQRSFDEMGDLWFQFVTRTDEDRTLLNAQIRNKMTSEDIVGYETMLRANPADAELHDDVAVLYLSLGRGDAAVTHFQASANLRPASAAAHFNVGTALSVAGRLDDAIRAYREALRLRPDYAAAHNNLGSVLAAQGNGAEAIAHFRSAAQADPGNVQAHRNLAWHIAQQPGSGNELLAEAVAAGERAAALTREGDPHVLDALAAAYRAAGMSDKAASMTERARRLRNGG